MEVKGGLVPRRFKSQIAVVRTSELIAPEENDTERPRLMRKMRQGG